MNDLHVLNELSDYIDGEARDPERIARHLQACPGCARRHMELLKLGAHLRALPVPRERPDFVAAVLDRTAREAASPRWRFAPQPLQWAMAAVLLLIAAAAFYFSRNPPPSDLDAHRLVAESAVYADDEAVVAALARLLDAGVDPASLLGPDDEAEDDLPPPSIDEMLEGLALAQLGPESELDFEDSDFFVLLDELSVEAPATLQGFLIPNRNAG